MFSYYGSKSKIINKYPPPKFGKIIEPFAGSARYSLKYWKNDVLLVDKYKNIVKIWKFLQNATKKDIRNLPEPKFKQSIEDFTISEDEKLLLGFMVANGVASPHKIVQLYSDIPLVKRNIIKSLHKIKHWKIKLGSYEEIKNEKATWFIDPPYMFGGEHYRESNKNIDYKKLSKWCQSRNGVTIVCENTKADWLPFKPIANLRGSMYKTVEAVYYKGFKENRKPGDFMFYD